MELDSLLFSIASGTVDRKKFEASPPVDRETVVTLSYLLYRDATLEAFTAGTLQDAVLYGHLAQSLGARLRELLTAWHGIYGSPWTPLVSPFEESTEEYMDQLEEDIKLAYAEGPYRVEELRKEMAGIIRREAAELQEKLQEKLDAYTKETGRHRDPLPSEDPRLAIFRSYIEEGIRDQ